MTELSEKILKNMGYITARQLDDGSWIALERLLFTTGLCMGLNEYGWSKRYCFDDFVKCMTEYDKLKKYEDAPEGWIAKRGGMPNEC